MKGLTSLIFYALIIGLGYYGWLATPPSVLKEFSPEGIMEVQIGSNAYYFPMNMIDPHYAGNEYMQGKEAEVWMRISTDNFAFLTDAQAVALSGQTLDVIITSDANPQTQKATEEIRALIKQEASYTATDFGLKVKKIGDETEYLGPETRISCGSKNCTLYTRAEPDLRLAIVFPPNYIPVWQKMVETIAVNLNPYRTKPYIGDRIASYMPKSLNTQATELEEAKNPQ